jgi:hypothetical protein
MADDTPIEESAARALEGDEGVVGREDLEVDLLAAGLEAGEVLLDVGQVLVRTAGVDHHVQPVRAVRDHRVVLATQQKKKK